MTSTCHSLLGGGSHETTGRERPETGRAQETGRLIEAKRQLGIQKLTLVARIRIMNVMLIITITRR